MSDDIKPIDVVYLGRTETTDNKVGMILLPANLLCKADSAGSARDLASVFNCKERDLPRVVGGAYVFDGALDDNGRMVKVRGNYKFDPAVHERVIVNKAWAAVWQACSDGARVAARARKLEADLAKDDKLRKLISPLRQRYGATDKIGRLALEVVVLNALRS